jgi:hypothetical protein
MDFPARVRERWRRRARLEGLIRSCIAGARKTKIEFMQTEMFRYSQKGLKLPSALHDCDPRTAQVRETAEWRIFQDSAIGTCRRTISRESVPWVPVICQPRRLGDPAAGVKCWVRRRCASTIARPATTLRLTPTMAINRTLLKSNLASHLE